MALRKIRSDASDRAVRHSVHATTTRPLGALLPPRGSTVTVTASGNVANAGASAIRRALPSAPGRAVPSEIHVVPRRAHARTPPVAGVHVLGQAGQGAQAQVHAVARGEHRQRSVVPTESRMLGS